MSRPLQSGGGGQGTEASFFFCYSGLVKANETASAPAAKYIEIRLIKAITQSTCLIASIRLQLKKVTKCSAHCSAH